MAVSESFESLNFTVLCGWLTVSNRPNPLNVRYCRKVGAALRQPTSGLACLCTTWLYQYLDY